MNFTLPGGPATIGPELGRAVRTADEIGIHSFWPMDHFFQIAVAGQPEEAMVEVYSTLAWAAGQTTRMQLGALVTGVHYRHPGLLLKTVSTLDVLSGGRAWLGLGAAWNEDESRGLGVPFPPLSERFERLEETLQIAHRMFSGDDSAFAGRHYQLEHPMNLPAPLHRPPILIGGMGERKTMRLIAQYGDANNFFELSDPAALQHKFAVLRQRCDEAERPYEELVKTTFGRLGERDLDAAKRRLDRLADLEVDLAIVDLPDLADHSTFDYLAQLVELAAPLGRPTPKLLG